MHLYQWIFENNLPKDKYEKLKNVKTNGYLHKIM